MKRLYALTLAIYYIGQKVSGRGYLNFEDEIFPLADKLLEYLKKK